MEIWRVSGATKVYGRHLNVCPYGFKRDMSEKVHLKVLFFHILLYFTLPIGVEVTKRDV